LATSSRVLLVILFATVIVPATLQAQQITLQTLVTPSSVVVKDGHPVTFAIHGFIEFESLSVLFPYIDSETRRWSLAPSRREQLARDLLRRGIESRVISMTDERPLETLITHTSDELRQAIGALKEATPPGYSDAFLAVQEKWKHAINCWSASSSISGRVLSNWYPIEEGIVLYGDTYDSTEHFWQAAKYHPDVKVGDLYDLIAALEGRDWRSWLARLNDDADIYLPNAYAVEFLRHNLASDRLHWFREELLRQGLQTGEHARQAQQRGARKFRFSAYEEKVLWGDLADLFQLVYIFSKPDDPIRSALSQRHFDGIYLGDRKLGFISEEFRSLMLDIWRVKYLQMTRFREVISGIPLEIRLEHFLNDGDSPDIPIPVYVGYLNQVRELARAVH